MDAKLSALVVLFILCPTAAITALEIKQFPEDNIVEIRENTSEILRFQVRASSLARTSVQYGINGSNEKHHPITSFNYNALHSAVAMPCNINNMYSCTELYIRVEGKQENHNTSFHLVLIEMDHFTSFRQLDIPNFFTVHIIPDTTDLISTTLSASTTNMISTTNSAPSTAMTPSSSTSSTSTEFSPDIKTNTVDNTFKEQDINTQLILFIALAVCMTALSLSCMANIIFCCLVQKQRKSQTHAVNV